MGSVWMSGGGKRSESLKNPGAGADRVYAGKGREREEARAVLLSTLPLVLMWSVRFEVKLYLAFMQSLHALVYVESMSWIVCYFQCVTLSKCFTYVLSDAPSECYDSWWPSSRVSSFAVADIVD